MRTIISRQWIVRAGISGTWFTLGTAALYLAAAYSPNAQKAASGGGLIAACFVGFIGGVIFSMTNRLNNRGEWAYAARWIITVVILTFGALLTPVIVYDEPFDVAEFVMFIIMAIVGGCFFAAVFYAFQAKPKK